MASLLFDDADFISPSAANETASSTSSCGVKAATASSVPQAAEDGKRGDQAPCAAVSDTPVPTVVAASEANVAASKEDYPDRILVTGFSLLFIGWTGVYLKQRDGSYRLPEHTLWILDIFPLLVYGVKLSVVVNPGASEWRLTRDGDTIPALISPGLFSPPGAGVGWRHFRVSYAYSDSLSASTSIACWIEALAPIITGIIVVSVVSCWCLQNLDLVSVIFGMACGVASGITFLTLEVV